MLLLRLLEKLEFFDTPEPITKREGENPQKCYIIIFYHVSFYIFYSYIIALTRLQRVSFNEFIWRISVPDSSKLPTFLAHMNTAAPEAKVSLCCSVMSGAGRKVTANNHVLLLLFSYETCLRCVYETRRVAWWSNKSVSIVSNVTRRQIFQLCTCCSSANVS